ncbi:MAG: Gfo/Idh/MocA family oxidoreductase, partial [Terracidiphilus sp.]
KSGALGRIATLAGMYNAPASTEKKRDGEGADEYRLRNWLWDRALSGDILVEQNIHIVDLANWLVGARPLSATASGGRSVITHFGDCWDHYEVVFKYPGDVDFSFSSTQYGAYGVFEAGLRIFGTEGMATYPYAGPVEIKGAHPWSWAESMKTASGDAKFAANGAFSDNLAFADREKERTFIASIVEGPAHNQIADGVETALSCMLGRMAGLRKREVTWDELLKHGENYELGMNMEQFA